MRWRPGAAPGAARRRRRCQQASRGVVHASRPAASGGGAWSSAPFHALWDAESRRIDDLDGLEDEAEDLEHPDANSRTLWINPWDLTTQLDPAQLDPAQLDPAQLDPAQLDPEFLASASVPDVLNEVALAQGTRRRWGRTVTACSPGAHVAASHRHAGWTTFRS